MKAKKITALLAVMAMMTTVFAGNVFAEDGVSAEIRELSGVAAALTDERSVQVSWEPLVPDVTQRNAGAQAETETAPAAEQDAEIVEQETKTAEQETGTVQAEAETAATDAKTAETEAEPAASLDAMEYRVYRTCGDGDAQLIGTTEETSLVDKDVTAGKTYWYSVNAFYNGEKYAESGAVRVAVPLQETLKSGQMGTETRLAAAKPATSARKPAKAKRQTVAAMTLIKKGSAAFDYRIAAGQKLYKYDTLQGACANKGFAYLTLYNRTVEKCKIVKVNLKTLAIVKVSKPLRVYHANNLTYNTRKNLLVATCCQVKKKRVVMINPNTLKVVSKKTIKLSKKVKNLPKKVRKKYKGFTAIAYNEKHDCYVGRLRYSNNVVIMNNKLKPIRYVVLQGKRPYLLNQGMESVGDYIYDVRSFKGKNKYCMVTIHTMSGKFVREVKFPYGAAPGNELQCIFHDGKQYYAGIYYSTSQYNDTKKNHVKRYNRLYRLKSL